MLVEIGDKVVSTQVFERKFVCDLNACKGACCIEGDAGAPLKREEIKQIEENLEVIKPYMREEGINAITDDGVYYLDDEGEPVTTLINGGECAFVFFDEQNIAKCSIEEAYNQGESDFLKPVSCHLYPIRVKRFHELTAINYDHWSICDGARACGASLNVPVFRFLKQPLIRAFGEAFYNELEIVSKEIE